MQDIRKGWINGMIGVALFSGSMPATRAAVVGFTPLFLTAARAIIAGGLGALMLVAMRESLPRGRQWLSLAMIAGGVVVGFPLLTAIALQEISAARSLVFVGLLPLSTALFGVLRGGERPGAIFWLFALLGAGCVAGYALSHNAAASPVGDALMVVAVVVCGLGYAEGAVLTRQMGGWQVICWALVICTPLAAVLAALTWPQSMASIGTPSWVGLFYVSVCTMLLGFIFWYRGLALGGIARVGQLQLLQPFLGLGLAAVFLHEAIAPAMLVAVGAVVGCVAGARRFA
ncbi:DMT family transporter [Novosphingobium sediminicola]|uniref:Drug/metabolite transporter (DMT)-like permease n=1 Tax=Novosphingobium sediminicola TaxID=563162 RepID=A0A7W6CDP8_9SPHN|nr:DMT family transporter [Novosphingobium sediminicola]MBB3953580.1 drug/metabolite transporter (DMT)-like permease [Novosphingobium sediminicola]